MPPEFSLDSAVAIAGLCVMTWPLVRGRLEVLALLPALMAGLYPVYPVNAAFAGYLAVLFLGTVYSLVELTGVWRKE